MGRRGFRAEFRDIASVEEATVIPQNTAGFAEMGGIETADQRIEIP
jgi:hypothetical protein